MNKKMKKYEDWIIKKMSKYNDWIIKKMEKSEDWDWIIDGDNDKESANKADDKVIEFSLKMLREGRVDFSRYVDGTTTEDSAWYLDSWFRHYFRGASFYTHVLTLLNGGVDEADYALQTMYELDLCSRKRKRNRCDLVVYGLLLYVLRCTGYDKWDASGLCIHKVAGFAEMMKPLLLAMILGWDFPDDSADYPLEFTIEQARSFIA